MRAQSRRMERLLPTLGGTGVRRRRSLAPELAVLLMATLAGACHPVSEDELSSAVFGPGERLHFGHLCANQYEHAASVWVVFVNENAGAFALAQLQAGWVGAQDELGVDTTGVALFPLRIRLGRPPAGPVEALRLVFQVGSAESGPDLPYLAAGESGTLSMSNTGRALAHNVPNGFAVPVSALSSDGDPVRLALTIRSGQNGEEIVLRGPEASGLAAAMRRPKPVVRVLGLPEVLDPAQEGGLVQTINEDLKFDRCLDIRRELIRTFDREARAVQLSG